MFSPLKKLNRELKWHKNEYVLFIVSLVIPGIICLIALNAFLDIAQQVQAVKLLKFDEVTSSFIFNYRDEKLTKIVIFITNLGDQTAYLLIIPAIAVLLFYRGHHRWKLSLQATLVLASAYLLNIAIKHLISRPRPLEDLRLVPAHSYSFPSGHSMSAIAFYGFIIYLTYKYVPNTFLKILLIFFQVLLILGIGLSRIYLGVHYPSDVLAGFIAGLVWLIICIVVFNFVNLYRKRQARKRNLLDTDSNQ